MEILQLAARAAIVVVINPILMLPHNDLLPLTVDFSNSAREEQEEEQPIFSQQVFLLSADDDINIE